jgi:hypothetical protein
MSFELALNCWPEFGLSRFSASRGLDTLERVEFVSTIRRLGRSPVVTILDANAVQGRRGWLWREFVSESGPF